MVSSLEGVLIIISTLLFIVLLGIIALWIKLNKLRKRYLLLVNGQSNQNLEQVLIELQQKMAFLTEKNEQTKQSIHSIEEVMRKMKSHVGICRYNAFSESGSDLSFSLAIVDEDKNGVVLSGIHSREQSYIYAKPVEKGTSTYNLSPEEKEAILRSVSKI